MWVPRVHEGLRVSPQSAVEMSTIGFLCLFLGKRVLVWICAAIVPGWPGEDAQQCSMGSKLDAFSNAAGVVDGGRYILKTMA